MRCLGRRVETPAWAWLQRNIGLRSVFCFRFRSGAAAGKTDRGGTAVIGHVRELTDADKAVHETGNEVTFECEA
jgi:hypothetical protein